MKLADCLRAYEELTAKASEITRKLGFAGIAIIWVFKTEKGSNYVVPTDLLLPGLLIVISLTLDYLQYVLGSFIWGCFHRYKEKVGTKDREEFDAPRQINWPANFFFLTKIATMILAYVLLAAAIAGRL